MIDNSLGSLRTRFETETIDKAIKLERFLLHKFSTDENILEHYKDDFDAARLKLHNEMFFDVAKQEKFRSVSEIKALFNKNKHFSEMLSEYHKAIRIF